MSAPIGERLQHAGLIDRQQLDAALLRQRMEGGRLASHCLELGFADEAGLARVLSLQLGVPFVVLSRSAIPLQLLGCLDPDEARRFKALPVQKDAGRLVLAMADPRDARLVDRLRFVTGQDLVEHGALMGPLDRAIEEAYRRFALREEAYFKGSHLDPGMALGAVGHAEIVRGRESGFSDSPRPATSESFPAIPPSKEIVAQDQTSPEDAPSTVLVVDDDDALRTMLVEFLTKSGYRAWQAADGRAAMRLLQQNLPDLILLDAMLPAVHGFDICRRVKYAESTRHIPVIMISAVYRGEEYRDKVRLHYGANAYVEKPLKLSRLGQVIQNCLTATKTRPPASDLPTRIAGLLKLADQAESTGDLVRAAEHLDRVLRLAPFFAALHCRQAQMYEKLGQLYRAVSQLEQAAELDQSYPILFHLARLYEKTGFVGKAVEAWHQCLLVCRNQKDAGSIRNHLKTLKA